MQLSHTIASLGLLCSTIVNRLPAIYNVLVLNFYSSFVNYAPTPEGNIGKLISQLSSCFQQVTILTHNSVHSTLMFYVGGR